ncbi:MAG: hypothetical protein HXY24_13495, partial [Rubrivivax sp.]|nr:hypothetical protein [Rubrivivax sp.]
KAQSTALSGTGGFAKGYVGLGYDFGGVSLGAHLVKLKFRQSPIDDTLLNVSLQMPFSYSIGSYAIAGRTVAATDTQATFQDSSENTLSWGLDSLVQIYPEGSNKATIRLAELQFAHHVTRSAYWFASMGVGYRGLPLYNQAIGGIGYRWPASSRVNLRGQVGFGSGGYAPETIDTDSGLLVYPKVSVEYLITKRLGLGLSTGYLFAPRGSSRNYSLGVSLSYHLQSERDGPKSQEAPAVISYGGYRISLSRQTEFNVSSRDLGRPNIDLLSAQLDTIVSEHVYLPVKVAVAYNAYLGYPGYGEFLAGVGVQTKYHRGDRLQFFGQLLGGTNVHGPVLKAGVGMNYGLSDRLAIYVATGKTLAASPQAADFRADWAGLGMSYRFSVPRH